MGPLVSRKENAMKKFVSVVVMAVVFMSLMAVFATPAMACPPGFTPGFWGNKNGLAAMQAFVAGGGTLPIAGTPEQIQAYFRAGSTAVDMCDKLEWHYKAYLLNVAVKGNDYGLRPYGSPSLWIDGQLVFTVPTLAAFETFDCATASREDAERYKDFFMHLNEFTTLENNYLTDGPAPIL